MAAPQPGQWEEGKIIDFPIGIRWAHTLRKLPKTVPSTKPM